jgi:hypothetical protein
MARPTPRNDYERRVVANVDRFGWHCTSVAASPGEASPAFSYTVGLQHAYGQPEFILFGLSSPVAHGILSTLADAAQSGAMFPLDRPCDALVEGFDCVFLPVPRIQAEAYALSAVWFYGGQEFPLYQVIWPDRAGRYPWMPGYAHDPAHAQPVLASAWSPVVGRD